MYPIFSRAFDRHPEQIILFNFGHNGKPRDNKKHLNLIAIIIKDKINIRYYLIFKR